MKLHQYWSRGWLTAVLSLASLASGHPSPASVPPPDPEPPSIWQMWPAAMGAPAGSSDFDLPLNCFPVEAASLITTTFPINDPPGPGSVVTASVTITRNIPYLFTVAAVTYISHTSPGDLVIDLISPDGTDVTLSNRRGGGHDDIFSQTTWLDSGGASFTPVTAEDFNNPPDPHLLIPEESMGAFQGKAAVGTWRLVVDDKAALDIGTLNMFGLIVIGINETPLTATSHFSQTTSVILSDTVDIHSLLPVNAGADRVLNAQLITNITHGKPRQLRIELTSPNAETALISNHNGGYILTNFANWFAGTIWTDKAGDAYPPGPVTMDQAVYPTSPLTATVPEGAMNQFLGMHPNGSWDLHITDNTVGAGGVLNSWGLDVTTGHCMAHRYLPTINR